MMRRTIGLLSALAFAGCGRTDAKVGANRTTLLAGPGAFGADISKDGRLAYAKYVEGKAAIYVANADGTNPMRVSFGVWDTGPIWSPDGKSIALVRDAGGQNDVVIVPADSGGELLVAATSATESFTGWLPDGSALMFVRWSAHGNEAWVFHLADHTSAKLFDADGSVDSWASPDGKWIAYTLTKGGKSTIWLLDREKKTHRQLSTEGFESVAWGCFSPDSRSILYTSWRTGTTDLWRIDVATGERRQLTQDVASDFAGRWSPDGTRILFASNRGGQPDLWVLTTGEADVQRVTDDAVTETLDLWTRDGRSVVASSALGQQHLYSLPTTGGPATALTSGDWGVFQNQAEISLDGTQIAYAGTKNGDADIWTLPVTGGESRLVSGAPGYDGEPAWAPDGNRVVFSSMRSGTRDLWIAPLDGSAVATRFTDWPSSETTARWSPDGNTIAFMSNRESAGSDVWTMPAAGGTARRITKLGTAGDPRWSPDSRTIAFSAQSDASGGNAVFTVDAAGGTPKQVGPATSFAPRWSPTGREIAIAKCTLGYCVIEIRSRDGKLVRTVSAKQNVYESAALWSSDGSQLLVGFQDLLGDGSNRMELRPAAGGAARLLSGPAGYNIASPVGLSASDKSAIVIGAPYGTALQRIAVPAAVKAP